MSATDDQAERAKYGKVIAKAWSDAAFKAKLMSTANAALTEAGLDVPAGVTIKVVEDNKSLRHLILPESPEGELSDEALDNIARAVKSKACTCR